MPRVRTTKTLAKRIDLQYFTRRDSFQKWRLWLAIAAPVAAVLWLVASHWSGNQKIYTSGPLSTSHALFTKTCQLCHLAGQNFRASVPDKACLGCHDAPAHKVNQTFTPACSSCHVEHQGKLKLAATSDRACTQCHADLHTNSGMPSVNPHVRNFDHQHPEFMALRPGQADKGTIRLNHFVHLQPTIRGPNGPVQMVCDDCHRPTNLDMPWPYSVAQVQPSSQQPVLVMATATQQRKRRSVVAGPGAYMANIKYVDQCAACHVLQFDTLIPQPAPHDKPEIVRAFIINKYTDYIAAHPEALRKSPLDNLGVDVAGSDETIFRPTGDRATPLATSARDWIRLRSGEAERLLWNKNCKVCHAVTEHEGSGLPQSVTAIIPSRWLARAEFDHQAHRMMVCASCHAGIPTSRETSVVNIPGIAVCRVCHKQQGASDAGVEGRCYECHSYHDWRKEQRTMGIMEIALPADNGH